MSTAVFYNMSIACYYVTLYSLSTVCQYLALHGLLVLCPYVQCCFLQSVYYLSVRHTLPYVGYSSLCPLLLLEYVHCLILPHTVPAVVSVLLCPLLSSTRIFCQYLTPQNLSTVSQYLTLYRLLFLCHDIHCSLLYSVSTSHRKMCPQSLSTSHGTDCSFVLICPMLPSKFSPMPFSTSQCEICLLSATIFIVWSVVSVTLFPLISSKICPLPVSTGHCTVCFLCVIFSTVSFCSLSIL